MPDDAPLLPPRPPSSPRAVRLRPVRAAGLVALVATVIGGYLLSSAGDRSVSAEIGASLRVEASHPAYAYLGQEAAIEVTVISDDATGPLTLRPDDTLLRAWGDLRATPPLEAAPDGQPEVTLQRLTPGDLARVTVIGTTEALGRLDGALEVHLGDERAADLPIRPFVYP